MNSDFLKNDARLHFHDCLMFIERQSQLVGENPREWHWTLIGLASLVQSASVLFLNERDTTETATLSNRSQEMTWKAIQHDSTVSPPKPFMAPPKELIQRVLRTNNSFNIQKDALDDLHLILKLRNQFMHFNPMIWSIELIGLPRISIAAINFCIHVLSKPGLYSRMPQSDREDAKDKCAELISLFRELGK